MQEVHSLFRHSIYIDETEVMRRMNLITFTSWRLKFPVSSILPLFHYFMVVGVENEVKETGSYFRARAWSLPLISRTQTSTQKLTWSWLGKNKIPTSGLKNGPHLFWKKKSTKQL